jgi:hypothetical protein
LVATEATVAPPLRLEFADDGVAVPIETRSVDIRTVLDQVLAAVAGEPIDAERWSRGNYRPTPTIIEAAKALCANHTVDEIARSDAGALNLQVTSRRVEELIDEAAAPIEERCVAEPMLAPELLHGRPSLHLLQEPDDLLISESRLLHARSLLRKSDSTHLPVALKTGTR